MEMGLEVSTQNSPKGEYAKIKISHAKLHKEIGVLHFGTENKKRHYQPTDMVQATLWTLNTKFKFHSSSGLQTTIKSALTRIHAMLYHKDNVFEVFGTYAPARHTWQFII